MGEIDNNIKKVQYSVFTNVKMTIAGILSDLQTSLLKKG